MSLQQRPQAPPPLWRFNNELGDLSVENQDTLFDGPSLLDQAVSLRLPRIKTLRVSKVSINITLYMARKLKLRLNALFLDNTNKFNFIACW